VRLFRQGGLPKIDSSVSWTDVSITVNLTSLLGTKLGENSGSEPVRFDLNARLEERERRSGRVVVLFGLLVRTKPNVAKYEVEGIATLMGKDANIEQILKVDPKSNIPFVFHRVYQHVFTAIYMLASVLGTIYPPPDLLLSSDQTIPIKNLSGAEHAESGKTPEAEKAANATEQAKPANVEVVSVKKEEPAVSQPAATT
jgi:hypothetical protein